MCPTFYAPVQKFESGKKILDICLQHKFDQISNLYKPLWSLLSRIGKILTAEVSEEPDCIKQSYALTKVCVHHSQRAGHSLAKSSRGEEKNSLNTSEKEKRPKEQLYCIRPKVHLTQ